jgi:DNA-binding transcriptional MerR regulator
VKNVYTIGMFSKVARMSAKALRFYDEIGLLKPAYVDPMNQYRYYLPEQVADALLICELREYSFSLDAIKEIIKTHNPKCLEEALAGKLEEMEREMSRIWQTQTTLKARIKRLEEGGPIMDMTANVKIEVKEKDPVEVVSLRRQIPLAQIGALIGELCTQLETAKVQVKGDLKAIYHDEEFNPEETDIEVCMTLVGSANGLNSRVLQGGLHASSIHVGSYAGLNTVYGAIGQWIPENGYTICNAPYEIYLVGPHNAQDEEKYVTEVCFPVAKK